MMKNLTVTVNNELYEVSDIGERSIRVNLKESEYELSKIGSGLFLLRSDGQVHTLFVQQSNEDLQDQNVGEFRITVGSREYLVNVDDEISLLRKSFSRPTGAASGTIVVKAPMPGLIVKVEAEVGEHVKAGQGILILEAMKMENEIRAPESGKIVSIHENKGSAVEKNEVLFTIQRDDE